MIQVALCEQALIKTNRKFEFDKDLEHMVSYQGMQSGLPAFHAGEFSAFRRFLCKMTVLQSLIFHISPNGKVRNRSYLDRI